MPGARTPRWNQHASSSPCVEETQVTARCSGAMGTMKGRHRAAGNTGLGGLLNVLCPSRECGWHSLAGCPITGGRDNVS